ncbi:MAG: hypothetical protein KKC64_04010 [Spirochaetes bacterium]|nr:hypothetical protein [Spirochaetota bacterium]
MNKQGCGLALAILLYFVSGTALFAQTTALADRGERSLDGRSWQWYATQSGLTVYVARPVPAGALTRIEQVVAVAESWQQIGISEIRVETGREADEYVIYPSRLEYSGQDYGSAVPAGLRLRYEGVLMYDFRARSGDYFVRVRGVLMGEQALLAELAKAVVDPVTYVAERDPGWAAARLADMQVRLDTLEADLSATLAASTSITKAALENLRLALAARMNRSLFGLAKALDNEALAFTLEYRQQHPEADNATILAAAKSAGHSLNAKQLEIIRLVWQ